MNRHGIDRRVFRNLVRLETAYFSAITRKKNSQLIRTGFSIRQGDANVAIEQSQRVMIARDYNGSAGIPWMSTGRIADVRSVIFSSISAGSIV